MNPSSDPTPADRLYAIVEQGLCIGCGLCSAVAPMSVSITTTPDGLRPSVTGDLTHEAVDTIYDVCPGTRVDGLPDDSQELDSKHDNVWGHWRRISRAWATDPEVRHQGSTGGVLTALGQYLVASGRVSFVLHTKASTSEPTFGESTMSSTEAEVFEAAGSRYGPTATLLGINEALAQDEPFAFIAKPCDIGALRNLARHDERVNRLVKYWLTLVCGGFGPPSFTEGFLERVGIARDDLTSLRYRGLGCPGPTTATTDSETVSAHYLDYWGDDETQWSLPWRCKICPDGIGDAADLAVSDTWPGGSPNRIDSETDLGINAIIARTAVGVELMEAAARDGHLTLEYDIVPDDLSIYQPHQVHKKYALAGRFQGLSDLGRIVPKTTGLRVDQLGAENPDHVNERQRAGTLTRVEAGKATEHRPASA